MRCRPLKFQLHHWLMTEAAGATCFPSQAGADHSPRTDTGECRTARFSTTGRTLFDHTAGSPGGEKKSTERHQR